MLGACGQSENRGKIISSVSVQSASVEVSRLDCWTLQPNLSICNFPAFPFCCHFCFLAPPLYPVITNVQLNFWVKTSLVAGKGLLGPTPQRKKCQLKKSNCKKMKKKSRNYVKKVQKSVKCPACLSLFRIKPSRKTKVVSDPGPSSSVPPRLGWWWQTAVCLVHMLCGWASHGPQGYADSGATHSSLLFVFLSQIHRGRWLLFREIGEDHPPPPSGRGGRGPPRPPKNSPTFVLGKMKILVSVLADFPKKQTVWERDFFLPRERGGSDPPLI